MNKFFAYGSVLVFLHVCGLARAAEPAAPSASGTNQTSSISNPGHVIAVGDKLGYRVVEDRDEVKVLTILPTGDLEVPYYGPVPVAGKTLGRAAANIKSLLEKDLYFQATVLLSIEGAAVAMKPKQVVVTGAVRVPGAQDMPVGDKCMLSRVILRAGGFTAFANGRKVRIVRQGEKGKPQEIVADVLAVIQDGKLDADVELKPDDLVIVKEKILNF